MLFDSELLEPTNYVLPLTFILPWANPNLVSETVA